MKKIYLLALIGACLTANAFFSTSGSENLNNLSSMSSGTQNMSGGGKTVKQGDNSNTLRLQSVPSGAVFMFEGNCPSGTTRLNMSGRAPVGEGRLNDGTLNHHYGLGQTGGKQRHQLTVAEMPNHNHTIRGSITGGNGNVVRGPDGFKGDWTTTNNSTNASGGNGYHENRMPYKVFNFCRVN